MLRPFPSLPACAVFVFGSLTLPVFAQFQDASMKRADGTDIRSPLSESDNQSAWWPPTPFERKAAEIPTIPRLPRQESTAGIVSVKQLRHPIDNAGLRRLTSAQDDLKSGRPEEAMQKLEAALEDPSTAGYANGILGAEYLQHGRVQMALEFLTESSRLLPGWAAARSNLGCALSIAGHLERGEKEIRTALSLDPRLYEAQFLLGIILLNRPDASQEAYEHLMLAQEGMRNANLGLAVLYARDGKTDLVPETLARLGAEEGQIDGLREWVLRAAALPAPAEAFGLGRKTGSF